jgi:hypothetical protein
MLQDFKLNSDDVRRIIFAPQNARRSVWTASSLLALRYGVGSNTLKGEAVEGFKPIRLRAARCLRVLWETCVIYRQDAMSDVGGWKEPKYVRPSDARGVYFVACESCRRARQSEKHPQGRILEVCPGCAKSDG